MSKSTKILSVLVFFAAVFGFSIVVNGIPGSAKAENPQIDKNLPAFRIQVIDVGGNPLAGAIVSAMDPGNGYAQTYTTGSDGWALFLSSPPENSNLCICADYHNSKGHPFGGTLNYSYKSAADIQITVNSGIFSCPCNNY